MGTQINKTFVAAIAGAVASAAFGGTIARADTALYYYDSFGRLVGTTASAGQVNGYVYDNANNRSQLDDVGDVPSSSVALLKPGEMLLQGQAIQSTDGRYILSYQLDGNVVLYDNGSAYWATNTVDIQSSFLVMQGDGNLVLYSPQLVGVWSSGTSSTANANSSLSLQTDGNLVIYNQSGAAIWASNTAGD